MEPANRGRQRVRAWLGAALLALVSACSSPPPPPTVVQLTMTTSSDVNPTQSGQGAPLQLVVYQLAAASGFEGADFFQLFSQDKATLGADLVKRDEFIVAPGQTKTVTLMPTDQAKTLGVFAAYRNYQGTTWRGSAPIAPHETSKIAVTAGKAGITVAAAKPGP